MAKAVILEKRKGFTAKIKQDNFLRSSIQTFYKPATIKKISGDLPFRVRFTAIGIEGSSGANVPPIPLQIIGFSNYIL